MMTQPGGRRFFAPGLFLTLLCLVSARPGAQAPDTAAGGGRVRICSFNIQIFGAAKMAKAPAARILADIVSRADMTAIQEVRSISIEPVENFMRMLPDRYAYVIGPREGRTSSKEQFWIIYDAEKFTPLAQGVWPDEEDVFERNPFAAYFRAAGGFDFIVINNHIRPDAAAEEIEALPLVSGWFQDLWNERDVLILGDFNADGRYYDETRLGAVFPPGEYRIILTNDYDTTLAGGDNTYDRFIITGPALEDYTGDFGVIRFDELYDFGEAGIEPRELSDHYPVWADFFVDRDTD